MSVLFAAVDLCPAASAQARGNRADYRISASLDGQSKVLTGRETISWTNGSGESVDDAWFHLYLNAFSNNRSTHLVEAKGDLRGHDMEDEWGWSRITAIAAVDPDGEGRVDLLPSFRYERPDDGNVDDRTVFAVDLPEAVSPGETVTLEVDWESQLPRVRRRTGYKDDFLLVAQWFPKLGVYEDGRGWNCHQFHMNSEFYSDYGTYEVELDLPARYESKVYASGKKEFDERRGDRYIARFVAPSTRDQSREDLQGGPALLHDFTWTADPAYHVETTTFRWSTWAEGKADDVRFVEEALGRQVSARDVDVTVLMQPERADQADRHFQATSAALFWYGLWYGEYPYEHLTVVDPAWGGGGAGGMEYPGLFTCGTRLFSTPDMYVPESVTVHECGHQFWYGLVGNNEFEAAWLDEGLNSYADSEVLYRTYGPRRGTTSYASVPVDGVPMLSARSGGRVFEALTLKRIPIPMMPLKPVRSSGFLDRWRDQPRLTFVSEWTDPRQGDRSGYLRDPDSDPIDTRAWDYVDRMSYRTNSYPRPAVALRTLAMVVGDEAFLRGMRHFSEAWRYRHPYAEDFFAAFQEGAEVECQWYFDEVFRSRDTGDWLIDVYQARRHERTGLFQSEGGEFLEEPAEDLGAGETEEPWQVEVVLRRDGNLSLEMPLTMTFEDGSTRVHVWSRDAQRTKAWDRISFESELKMVSAVLDSERRNYLDSDLSNNAWHDEVDELVPWRFGERVLSQLQHHLHWIGGIGG